MGWRELVSDCAESRRLFLVALNDMNRDLGADTTQEATVTAEDERQVKSSDSGTEPAEGNSEEIHTELRGPSSLQSCSVRCDMDSLVLVLMSAAGLATVLGAIPVFAIRRLTHRVHDTLLGFAAGIMLAVAGLDLLPQSAEQSGGDATLIAVGIGIGAGTIALLVRVIRRVPLPMPFVRNGPPVEPGAAFLIFVALAIHNAPEGLATGLGYAQGLTPSGHAVALSIASQNVPEGLLVSVAVFAETGSRRAALGYTFLSGLVEPVAGVIALLSLGLNPGGIGFASAFAMGAMVSVVGFQMIPESHRHGYHGAATSALLAGVLLAVGIDWSVAASLG